MRFLEEQISRERFAMKMLSIRAGKPALTMILAGCFMVAAALPALPGLGDNVGSIQSDAAVMRGAMAQPSKEDLDATQSGSYSVKTFVTENGVTVREYAAPSGTVFGVAWRGHRPPDLNVLLSSYYPEYSSASAAKTHRDLHRSVTASPNAIVMMSGHMGHVVGRAYVPSLVPSGVDAKAVVK